MMRSSILRLDKGLSESATRSADKYTTTTSAMIFAYYAEKATGKAQVGALDHLSRLIDTMTPAVHDDDSKDPLRSMLGEEGRVTFSAYAVFWGLSAYIRQKLPEYNRLKKIKSSGEPNKLLQYAIRPPKYKDGTRYPPISVEMVALLLRNGESPNQIFRGISPWESALAHVYETEWDEDRDVEHQTEYVNVLGLLLKTGANPQANYKMEAARDIIEMKLKGRFPLEAENLIKEIESRGVKIREVTAEKQKSRGGLRMWLKRGVY